MKSLFVALIMVTSFNASANARDCKSALDLMTHLLNLSVSNFDLCRQSGHGSAVYAQAKLNERANEQLFAGTLLVCRQVCAGVGRNGIGNCTGTLTGACP